MAEKADECQREFERSLDEVAHASEVLLHTSVDRDRAEASRSLRRALHEHERAAREYARLQ